MCFHSGVIARCNCSRLGLEAGAFFAAESRRGIVEITRRETQRRNNFFDYVSCDDFTCRSIAVQQRVIADIIYHSRDALRHVAYQFDSAVVKEVHILRARLLQPEANVLVDLKNAERLD